MPAQAGMAHPLWRSTSRAAPHQMGSRNVFRDAETLHPR